MILLTDELKRKLRENAQKPDADHAPVVKFFDPSGAGTWLFTALDEDGDTLFGLCDLGYRCPELGCASLSELEGAKGLLGLGIERDLYFEPRAPLSVYADAAETARHIVWTGPEFEAALARHRAKTARQAESAKAEPRSDSTPSGRQGLCRAS